MTNAVIESATGAASSRPIMQLIDLLGTKECNFVHWDSPTSAAVALIEINGKYLLARNHAWPEGLFLLISGFIEAGESQRFQLSAK
jgi:NADH pyrophosphatase NudC (nudix superfamily)